LPNGQIFRENSRWKIDKVSKLFRMKGIFQNILYEKVEIEWLCDRIVKEKTVEFKRNEISYRNIWLSEKKIFERNLVKERLLREDTKNHLIIQKRSERNLGKRINFIISSDRGDRNLLMNRSMKFGKTIEDAEKMNWILKVKGLMISGKGKSVSYEEFKNKSNAVVADEFVRTLNVGLS
jgi:hypothetical protein